jgi:hypothetical protein
MTDSVTKLAAGWQNQRVAVCESCLRNEYKKWDSFRTWRVLQPAA